MQGNCSMKEIINHLKEFGFIAQSSEIYGGLANAWDFLYLGVILKNKIKLAWWNFFIKNHQNNVALDSTILLNSKVWMASGHLDNFNDPLIDCKACKSRFRADNLINHYFPDVSCDGWSIEKLDNFIKEKKLKCLNCQKSDFTNVRKFQQMFQVDQNLVANENEKEFLYLRPETAQGIFINLKNISRILKMKLPFGVGQIGKSFRNEITPGNSIFRTWEFEQMELEFAYNPADKTNWFAYWLKEMTQFIENLGINNYSLKEHSKEELSHYSKATTDIQYNFPFGKKELCGLANRGSYDLKKHSEASKKDFLIEDSVTQKKVIPYIIEPSMGVERLFLAIICENLVKEKFNDETKNNDDSDSKARIVLKLNALLAPYHVAVSSIHKNKLGSKAQEVFAFLQKTLLDVTFDQKSNIGQVYNYHDQIGTLYCVTIDHQTLDTNKVAVRDRDTRKQEWVAIDDLKTYLYQKLNIVF